MGEHLVVKDYNIKILEINNHVHLIIYWKLTMDLYGFSIHQKWTTQPCIHPLAT